MNILIDKMVIIWLKSKSEEELNFIWHRMYEENRGI